MTITLEELGDFFDYQCPKCKNYIMLERSKNNKILLEGKCAKCGLDISIFFEDWEEWEKETKGDYYEDI